MASSDGEKRRNVTPYFPMDIIYEILLLLPIEFLCDCARYVCKEWLSIIQSPSFIEACLLKSKPVLLIHGAFEQYSSHSLYVENGIIERKPLRFSFQGIPIDSCRGLCLFLGVGQQNSQLYVVNPTTKQIQELPSLGDGAYMCSHLLYISQSGKYKVVCCFLYSGNFNWFVFTLGTDVSWRNLNVMPVLSPEEEVYPATSVTVGPFLYFSGCKRVIVAVNLQDGTVSSGLIPDAFSNRPFLLLRRGDTVCCIKLTRKVVHTWALRNLGESEWIKDSEYQLTPNYQRFLYCYVSPVGWLDNGQVFVTEFKSKSFRFKSSLVFDSAETGKKTTFAIGNNPPFYSVLIHTNSLVRW